MPRNGEPLSESMLKKNLIGSQCEYREAVPAVKYRGKLAEQYGEEKAAKVFFAEAYGVCEYGAPLAEENIKEIFML